MAREKIKAGSKWRHKYHDYHVTVADLPPNAPKGTVAHQANGCVRLYSVKDFRAKFEPLPQT